MVSCQLAERRESHSCLSSHSLSFSLSSLQLASCPRERLSLVPPPPPPVLRAFPPAPVLLLQLRPTLPQSVRSG